VKTLPRDPLRCGEAVLDLGLSRSLAGIPSHLGRPKARSKWLGTKHIGSCRAQALLSKPAGLGMTRPDLAGLTQPDGQPD
jgi:hypothetical protein